MNITQTRQVLTYIWSTHPSGPKYDDDGKTAIIASYFRVLCQYDIQDVLAAVDTICRESATFIPSAYEIEARVHKTLEDSDNFLSVEYFGVCRKIEAEEEFIQDHKDDYEDAFAKRIELTEGVIFSLMEDDQRAELEAKLAPLEEIIAEYGRAQNRLRELKRKKEDEEMCSRYRAECDYERKQLALAHNDLMSLGYDRLALEG